LREPYDRGARSRALTARALDWIVERQISRIVDLGAGTGSTFRFLAPKLTSSIPWTLVDIDAENLARIEALNHTVDTRVIDLSRELPECDPRTLLTASAFLDLVSPEWIERFSSHVLHCGCALYVTLTVDGRHTLTPEDPDDAWIFEYFRRHQTETDKGFGIAAGPDAHALLVRALTALGFAVEEARSDWMLDAREILVELTRGIADAAGAIGEAARAKAWASRRAAQAWNRKLRMEVGHRDLFASPPR
ncbi:MAG: class I SAM-dependent methyltransferase, partial [Myxococcota bacterium]